MRRELRASLFLVFVSSLSFAQTALKIPNGLDPSRISLPAKQGTLLNINGTLGVAGQTGATSVDLPLGVPEWRKLWSGLALSYSSNDGLSPYGYGWQFKLPSIQKPSRLGIPQADDQLFSSTFDNEIVSVGGDHFRARLEDAEPRIYAFRNGVFSMQDGSGKTFTFGEDPSARIENGSMTLQWFVTRISDPFNNQINFEYEKINNVVYPKTISFREATGETALRVQFTFAAVPGFAWTSWRIGAEQEFSRFLKKIEIFSGNNRIRGFEPHYELDALNHRPLVTEIKRWGRTEADVIPSWKMGYSPADPLTFQTNAKSGEYTFGGNLAPLIASNEHRLIDLNRDGLVDVLSRTSTQLDSWYAWMNPGQGDTEMRSNPFALQNFELGSGTHTFADVNGDRQQDLLLFDGIGFVRALYSTPQGYKEAQVTGLGEINFSGGSGTFDWVDLDADSKADLVSYLGGSYQFYKNVSLGDSIKFVPSGPVRMMPENMTDARRWIDFNGDGLPDLLRYLSNTSVRGSAGAVLVAYQDGYGTLKPDSEMIPVFQTCCLQSEPDYYDLNNDGLTDILLRDTAQVEILLQSRDKEGLPQFSSRMLLGPTVGKGTAETLVTQINQLVVADVNGDGEEDLVYTTPESNTLRFVTLELASVRPHLLEKHENGLGEISEYAYGVNPKSYDLPIVYTTVQTLKGTGLVAGPNGKVRALNRSEAHRFRSGFYDFERNEFVGFSVHETYEFLDANSSKGRYRLEEKFGVDNALLQGLTKRRETRSLDGIPATTALQVETFEYGLHAIFGTAWIRYPKSQESRRIEGPEAPKVQRFLFCHELDPSSQTIRSLLKRHMNALNQVEMVEEVIYLPSSNDNWRTQLPAVEAKYLPQGNSFYRAEGQAYVYENNVIDHAMYWDDRKQPAQWTKYIDVSRNSSGSVVQVTDPKGRFATIDYVPAAPYLVENVIERVNSFGREQILKSHYEWDLTVDPKIHKVTDPNGQIQQFDWDGLGRLVAMRSAGSAEADYTFTYTWGNDQTLSTIVTRTRVSDGIATTQYFDSLQREVGTIVPSTQGYILKNYQVLDPFGRLQSNISSMPISADSMDSLPSLSRYLHQFGYDAVDRLVSSRAPWLSAEAPAHTIVYRRDYTYIKNSENEVEVNYLDEQDRVCGVSLWKDRSLPETGINKAGCGLRRTPVSPAEFLVNIGYDGLDRIVALNLNGMDERSYGYGSNGALATVRTPFAGNWKFLYDDAGQLLARYLYDSSDRAKEAVLFSYDQLGRETERKTASPFTGDFAADWSAARPEHRFFYDAAVVDGGPNENTKGRIAALELFSGARIDFGYDARGNRTRELARLYAESLETNYSFDELNRPTQITFPDKSVTTYSYESGKHLLPTGGNFGGLDFSIAYDASLSMSEFAAGPFRSTAEIDPVRLIPKSVESFWNDQPLTSLKFPEFDTQLRIKRIVGWNSTDNAMSVEYDGLGQIKRFLGKVNNRFQSGQTYSYSPDQLLLGKGGEAGSIVRNSGGFDLNFANQVYKFGDLGRLVKSPEMTAIDWDPQARLGCLATVGSEQTRYSYYPDGRVFGMESSVGGKPVSIAFLNQYADYERGGKMLRKYLHVNGRRFAYQDGNGSVTFYGRDQVRSARALASDSERKVLEMDPWGSLQKQDFAAELQGFGDGRHQPATSLVQFKGRYYHTEIGWFVSPDSQYLLDPTECLHSPIECNLYSYSKNDPLNHYDEEGEWAQFVAAAVVGGTINLTVDYLSGNVTDWRQAAGSFTEGAISGVGAVTGNTAVGAVASGLGRAAKDYIVKGKVDVVDAMGAGSTSFLGGKLVGKFGDNVKGVVKGRIDKLQDASKIAKKEFAAAEAKVARLRPRALTSESGKYGKRLTKAKEDVDAYKKGLESLKANIRRNEAALGAASAASDKIEGTIGEQAFAPDQIGRDPQEK